MDAYYTPESLADKLMEYVNNTKLESIADFCVGDGQLLKSAQKKWPSARFYGYDISNEAIKHVESLQPYWKLSKLDFLNRDMQLKVIGAEEKFDAIFLNPPFSCRGATINKIEFDDKNFNVSTAMAFLVNAIRYLKPKGVLFAILPMSVAYSQKDRNIWKYLVANYGLCVLEEHSSSTFKGCSPSILLVSLNDFDRIEKSLTFDRVSLDLNDIEIFRGKISMDKIPKTTGRYNLIHTTNLIENSVKNLSVLVGKHPSICSGPAVLLPRVGNPKREKICVISKTQSYALSDCIIAIKTKSIKDANSLKTYMIKNWDSIDNMYKGTAARYITIERLKRYLNLDLKDAVSSAKKAS